MEWVAIKYQVSTPGPNQSEEKGGSPAEGGSQQQQQGEAWASLKRQALEQRTSSAARRG